MKKRAKARRAPARAKKACDKNCGLVMHMTGGYHRTDCAANESYAALRTATVNVSFDVSQVVAAALRALRDTGLFGNGVDCASIAKELFQRALLQPDVSHFWRKKDKP